MTRATNRGRAEPARARRHTGETPRIQTVVATGPFQVPRVPAVAQRRFWCRAAGPARAGARDCARV